MRTHFVSITALVLCTLSFWPSLARAKLVPIAITAEVTQVFDDFGFLEGRVGVGGLITGVYIYDSSTPDLDPEPYSGVYEHRAPPCGVTLTVGGFVFMTDPSNVEFIFEIENDYPTIIGPRDRYKFRSENNLPLSNSFQVEDIMLHLYDSSANALLNDALPTTAPVLDDWGFGLRDHDIYIEGGTWRLRYFVIYGRLTSAVLIPEPATISLLALGSLALLNKRRRRK